MASSQLLSNTQVWVWMAGVFIFFNLPLVLIAILALVRRFARPAWPENRFRAIAKLLLVLQGYFVFAFLLFNFYFWYVYYRAAGNQAGTGQAEPWSLSAGLRTATMLYVITPLILWGAPLLAAMVWFIVSGSRKSAARPGDAPPA